MSIRPSKHHNSDNFGENPMESTDGLNSDTKSEQPAQLEESLNNGLFKKYLKRFIDENAAVGLPLRNKFKTGKVVLEGIYSQRRTSSIYNEELYNLIVDSEIADHGEKNVQKYKKLSDYPLVFVEDHGDVLSHSFHLLDLIDKYPLELDYPDQKLLKQTAITHDLGEISFRDVPQGIGKTADDRVREREAVLSICSELYEEPAHEHIFALLDELERKETLRRAFKIYEEMSHINGIFALHDQQLLDNNKRIAEVGLLNALEDHERKLLAHAQHLGIENTASINAFITEYQSKLATVTL